MIFTVKYANQFRWALMGNISNKYPRIFMLHSHFIGKIRIISKKRIKKRWIEGQLINIYLQSSTMFNKKICLLSDVIILIS